MLRELVTLNAGSITFASCQLTVTRYRDKVSNMRNRHE